MANQRVEKVTEKLVSPIIEKLKCELVDIEYKKEGSQWYLRIYIDKSGGVTIDDCQAVSERVSDLLDEADPIPYSYILEVSSPGLDRVLKKEADFIRYTGSKVDISLYRPVHASKKHTGVLEGISDDLLSIKVEEEIIAFKRTDIAMVRLAVEF
ncbi:MAG TPA: ribosome maturation factor RimP [Bacillota bacterium]|nr:ribosome maturation factor RimP [Bacillota bacterium]